MGAGNETIFDLMDTDELKTTIDAFNKAYNKSLTDLERWKSFLDNMNINYKEERDDIIELSIHDDHLEDSSFRFGVDLSLIFDEYGNFKYFSPWGE